LAVIGLNERNQSNTEAVELTFWGYLKHFR